MTLYSIPFDHITEAELSGLKDRQIPEGPTLDYKRNLVLDDDGKFELVKDVVAFANASGGVLVYGAAEGEGEECGYIADLPGLQGSADETIRRVEQILRDSIEERLPGVLVRAVPRGKGGFFLLIRVPASPLAPHMISVRTTKPRFYLRASASSQPMTLRQVKDLTLHLQSAENRAIEWIAFRRARFRSAGWPHAVLHIVPLLAGAYALDLADQDVVDRLRTLPCLGNAGAGSQWRYTIDGFENREAAARGEYSTMVTRRGAVEFVEADLVQPSPRTEHGCVHLWDFENGVLAALDAVRQLTAAGLVELPVIVGLSLSGTGNALVQLPRGILQRWYGHAGPSQLDLEPILVTEWGESANRAVRQLFDTLWQAFGFASSSAYNEDGSRRPYPHG